MRKILAATLVLSWAALAQAQVNARSSPLGGRSALMGGTGIALGRDGAAPFSNPATIVRIDDRKIAFSVHFLAVQAHRFKHWHAPADVDPRFGDVRIDNSTISSTRLTALPSTICLFLFLSSLTQDEPSPQDDPSAWKNSRQKFAVCFAALESEDLMVPALALHSSTGAGATAQAVSLARRWNRTQIGPSYSARISDALALGASLHGAITSTSFIQDSTSITSMTDGSATQSSLGASGNGSSLDLTAILGGTYDFGGLTLGASVQVPSLHLRGSYKAALHSSSADMAGSNAVVVSGSGRFRATPPVRVAVGVGGTLNRLTLEANASLDFGKSEALWSDMQLTSTAVMGGALTTSTSGARYSVRTRPTINAAVGAEYFTSPRLSLLGGLWTNFSALPPLTPSPAPSLGNLAQARSHRVGISFGIGSHTGAGELLIGTQLGYGWGQSLVANPYAVPNDWSVVSSQSYSALFIIAGATNLRSIKRAIDNVSDALLPDAAPEPKRRP